MTPSDTATAGLAGHVSGWHPTATRCHDDLLPDSASRLAATLNLDSVFGAGDVLPLLWHWVYFLDWPPTAALGHDGHPRDGHFLPPVPDRRRMFAGGRLRQLTPMRLGAPAVRESAVGDITVKQGRSGEMLFVTVRHEYHQHGNLCVVEEQDLVYRSVAGPTAAAPHDREPFTAAAAPWALRPTPDPVLLFRFSALTANAHRIHYDSSYATGTEGYPGLVVHGPLLTLYMSELLRANSGGRVVDTFEFRLRKPVFIGDDIAVHGVPHDSHVDLSVVSGAGTIHASATVELQPEADR